jgi:ferritin, dps family protein
LDERPIGSLKGCLEHNRIKEQDEEKALPDAKGMLTALLDDNAELIRQIREDLETIDKEESKDFGTSNFLEDMIEKKEKVTWMIRAHLE